MATGVSWSPYYKVTTEAVGAPGFLLIKANGVPHQLMAPAQWKVEQGERIYETPYLRLPDNNLGDVLVVGAGSGSDVAIALREGARRVDAVDIDPRILEIGAGAEHRQAVRRRRRHTHTNDGRAFLEGTDRKYDLMLFALPDSLTLVSGASQIRLERFLFTEEAMSSVREHLSPSGAFAMYNYYRENWLIDRLAGTAKLGFGHAPCIDTFGGGAGRDQRRDDRGRPAVRATWAPPGPVVGAGDRRLAVPVLQGRLVPAALHRHAARHPARVAGRGPRARRSAASHAALRRPVLHGRGVPAAGDQERRQFALLFGTTWFVNALVFAGVLVVVLAAVETTRRFRTPPLPAVFGGIAASLVLAWVVQPDWLLPLPFAPRLVVATLLAFLPIYLANVAFAKRFQDSADSQSAFAINLLGAIVGGCLEYAALVTGYNNLLVVTGRALPGGVPADPARGRPARLTRGHRT